MIIFQFHQTQSKIVLAVCVGLVIVWFVLPHFDHDLFCTILSYVTLFYIPRYRNGVISFLFVESLQIGIRSIKCSYFNSSDVKTTRFFFESNFMKICNCFVVDFQLLGDVTTENLFRSFLRFYWHFHWIFNV